MTPGTFFQQVTPQQADLSQPWAASLELYITPWGFLKGAAANNATASRRNVEGKSYTVLSWSPAVKAPSGKSYTVNGYLNDQNLLERVETWNGENIMGDMHILATYSGWKDFGGAMAPAKIVQTRGGWPFFEVDVTAAKANPPDVATLRPSRRPPAGPPAAARRSAAQPDRHVRKARRRSLPAHDRPRQLRLADRRVPRSHHDARGWTERGACAPYIAEAKKLIPNKPIRYVMNTHAHADHTGGLPALVAEGATIITQKNNEEFFERALNTPRTLLNDTLAKNPKKATVEPVADKKVYTDGTRVVEMYHISPAPHSNGLMVALIPKERVLFQGDFSVPAAGQPANDHVKALVPALEKLNLDFDRYINVHAAAPQTKADVWAPSGSKAIPLASTAAIAAAVDSDISPPRDRAALDLEPLVGGQVDVHGEPDSLIS